MSKVIVTRVMRSSETFGGRVPPHKPTTDHASEIASLQERIRELEGALEPFANACFNDNGDITVDMSFATYDDFVRAYFAHRRARASLKGTKP